MEKEYSPFTPGVPVPTDFFVGRVNELHDLVHRAGAAAHGSFERCFVLGERGIGKSSFCRYAAIVAETKHRLLPLHTFLGGVSTLPELVRRVFDSLLRDSIDRPWYKRVTEFLGNHVRQIDLFGVAVEFSPSHEQLDYLVRNFVPALTDLHKRLTDFQGLMLALDDINGLASSTEFANWLKSRIDEIATARERLPLLLVLVGLPERRSSLIHEQPSLARVFDLVEIPLLSRDETDEFFRRAFGYINVQVETEALEVMWQFSGGFPPFAHEIGDAALRADSDEIIRLDDASDGVVQAAEIIGRKYVEPQVYEAIRSRRYRSILRKLPQGPLYTHFQRRDIVQTLGEEERRVFDNFLRKMRQLDVLRPDRELGPGGYRFTTALHALFFWLEAGRAARERP